MSCTQFQRVIETYTPGPCCQRPHNTYLHVAAIIKRGKVLATAQNRIGSRSRGAGWSDQTIHAEKAVVKELGDISQLRGAILCVWRVSTKSILPSKPCSDCEMFLTKCMREYGLRSVFYTDNVFPL
jgi:hypothetical protein